MSGNLRQRIVGYRTLRFVSVVVKYTEDEILHVAVLFNVLYMLTQARKTNILSCALVSFHLPS